MITRAAGELGAFIQDLGGFNPTYPNALVLGPPDRPEPKAPFTDEFQVSVDRELLADFSASVYRHIPAPPTTSCGLRTSA